MNEIPTHAPSGNDPSLPREQAGKRKIHLPHLPVLLALAVILLLSYHFRTHRLLESPGWFCDEGTYLEVARKIGRGSLQLGAVNLTFAGPNMTHPPLYFAVSNFFLNLGQPDMYHFRLMNALIGVLATFFLFLLGYEAGRFGNSMDSPSIHAEILGLLAALFFAIHPDAVLYNRMGMPYNLYLLEGIVMAWFALRYLRKREFPLFLAACITASLALLTVYYSVVFIPFLLFILIKTRKTRHLWALACVPIPLLIFLGFMALGNTPGFWEDIVALRKAAGAGKLWVTLYHYHDFFQTGITYFIGLAGLLLLRRKNAAGFLFFLYFLMIHIVLRKGDTIIRFVHYPVIPILPFMALGCAAFALWALDGLLTLSWRGLLVIPVILACYLGIVQVRFGIHGRFASPLEFGMTKNASDSFETAAFINTKTRHDDLVIASATLWSLLDARYADFPQSLAYEGIKSSFYKHDFPRQRFLYSPSRDRAAFIVMDHFTNQWRNSSLDSPHAPLVKAIKKVEEGWPLVFERGEYRVYRNPNLD